MSWFDRHLLTEFRERAEAEKRFAAQRDKRNDKERDDARQDQIETAESNLQSAVEQAREMREIEARLEALDLQVTQALVQNDHRLDAVRERIAAMLCGAFVLPDGRRVFKTEDGTQVFDEFGEEVPPDIVNPDCVDDGLVSWEEFQSAVGEEADLTAERQRLLDLQERVDSAQEKADAGEFNMEELDALEAEFGAITTPEPSPDGPIGPGREAVSTSTSTAHNFQP